MKIGNVLVFASAWGLVTLTGLARAQAAEEEAAPAATANGHASGLMVQGRLQTQGGLLSLGGGPGFVVGYQGQSFAVGLGLSLNRIGISAGSDIDGSATLFQIMPTAMIDVWQSADGRARANIVGGVGYGRASLSATGTSRSCSVDGLGNETCTTQPEDESVGATLIPLMLGSGGDYFFSRNFALGAEAGLQAAFVTGVSAESSGTSRDIDGSGNLQLGYGLIRATFVLGN